MKKLRGGIANVLLMLLGAAFLSPFYIMLVNSMKNRAQMATNILGLPARFTLEYYGEAMRKMDFAHALGNSLIMAIGSIAMIVVFTSMTGWMLARTHTKTSRFLFFLFVATMLIPFQSIMMPLVQLMGGITSGIGIPMLDTRGGLMYMYLGFGASMGVFLYHGFITSAIPVALEEAATIDGCSKWGVFWRIVFPMLKTTTITLAILDVIWIWNDFLLPSLMLSSKGLRTIPLSTYSFFGQFTIQWNLAISGLVLTIIPVILFYLFAQKYIVKGVAAGAIK